MKNLYFRLYQAIFRIVVALIPMHFPEVIAKENALDEVVNILKNHQKTKVLLVSDPQLALLGLFNPLLDQLTQANIHVEVFAKTHVNPTLDDIEDATKLYRNQNCEALIAFGGGSAMDCAKGVGARIARPSKSISQMRGVLKINRRLPLLIAIPTTAGTGSETTLAAVVTNPKTHEKYALTDPMLFPKVAILDPHLTLNLPSSITATTGMDALTHAVEAYLGNSNTPMTEGLALDAIDLIFKYLKRAYDEPHDLVARLMMQQAAFKAGKAFTLAYVGNVHAIAHTFGGFYNTPHGLANAVLLPKVLRYYGQSIDEKLSDMALHIGLEDQGIKANANAFIEAIEGLNTSMKIPTCIGPISEKDIPKMVKHAYKEANPFYPVPVIFEHKDFETLIKSVSVCEEMI